MINIVLYEPLIPENTGNIMRTCVATNTPLHLIRPLGFSLDAKTLKRSGVNYIDKLQLTVYDDYEDFKLKNKGNYYFLTRYGKKPHTTIDFTKDKKNIYLIFGKETTGIPKNILKEELNNCFRIPMSNNVRSLNLSNCVAIVVYEVLRQFNYPSLYLKETFKSEDYLEE
ncbi:MAG: tRNA (cytidine(34)-2'-O)-methyltransferase [bacterium]|nr:tRNA (cytidine(34)-2'-O)-methyltransferase [bacterium]